MKFISIRGSKISAIVDDVHYDRISQYTWCITPRGKVYRNVYIKATLKTRGKSCIIPLANEVMQNYNVIYDHIDRHKENNLVSNLRECNNSQNNANRAKWCGNGSSYKGVTWYKRHSKWAVQIRHNGKPIHLGQYTTEVEAASVYNKKAKELFGEFAVLNKNNKGEIL